MKRFFMLCTWTISLIILIVPSSCRRQVVVQPDQANFAQSDAYAQAKALFEEKKYDAVIERISGPAHDNPYNFTLNILLAKAQLEKCAILKENGNKSYKTLIYEPYAIGQRLHKMDERRYEPYYIVAKSLLINNRAHKAKRTIKKALYFAPNDAESLLVLGDAYFEIARREESSASAEEFSIEDKASRLFSQARDAYEMALEKKEEFRDYVEKKLKEISEKLK